VGSGLIHNQPRSYNTPFEQPKIPLIISRVARLLLPQPVLPKPVRFSETCQV